MLTCAIYTFTYTRSAALLVSRFYSVIFLAVAMSLGQALGQARGGPNPVAGQKRRSLGEVRPILQGLDARGGGRVARGGAGGVLTGVNQEQHD